MIGEKPLSTLLSRMRDDADRPLRRGCGHCVSAGQQALTASSGRSASSPKAAARRHSPPNNGRTAKIATPVGRPRYRPKRSFEFLWRRQAERTSLDTPNTTEWVFAASSAIASQTGGPK